MLKAIAAVDEKMGISKNGKIPWDIPSDGRYFHDKTKNGSVIMGRKTYEYIGGALAKRENIVISSSLKEMKGVRVFSNLEDAIKKYPGAWIIGGERIYKESIQKVDKLYLTRIIKDFDCDRYFPAIPHSFRLTYRSSLRQENGLDYYFEEYERI